MLIACIIGLGELEGEPVPCALMLHKDTEVKV